MSITDIKSSILPGTSSLFSTVFLLRPWASNYVGKVVLTFLRPTILWCTGPKYWTGKVFLFFPASTLEHLVYTILVDTACRCPCAYGLVVRNSSIG
jgi:hypothetical protein